MLLLFRWPLYAVLLLIITPCAHAVQTPYQIKIPWGFQWGEPLPYIERELKGTKVTIIEHKKIGEREVLMVSGFIERLLLNAAFYFQNGGLTEIELQYGEKNWGSTQYRDFFDQTCNNIENKYGAGRVLTQQKSRQNEGVLETIIGYQWIQVAVTLQVYLFTAEKGPDSFHMVSLHYRGF